MIERNNMIPHIKFGVFIFHGSGCGFWRWSWDGRGGPGGDGVSGCSDIGGWVVGFGGGVGWGGGGQFHTMNQTWGNCNQ